MNRIVVEKIPFCNPCFGRHQIKVVAYVRTEKNEDICATHYRKLKPKKAFRLMNS